jgi:DNA-directed RNA polymerase specialized sigma24 family protein
MIRPSGLTQASLDQLLEWLDHDRETAGQKYEKIRRALVKVFAARGCHCADDLADETLSRVAKKASNLAATYEGDPLLYFYGVAGNVHHEYLRVISRESSSTLSQTKHGLNLVTWTNFEESADGADEARLDCLTKCLHRLPDDQRQLVTSYYENEQGEKITSRKVLADRNRMSINALRLKAHRVRRSLRQCVLNCLEGNLRHESSKTVICV